MDYNERIAFELDSIDKVWYEPIGESVVDGEGFMVRCESENGYKFRLNEVVRDICVAESMEFKINKHLKGGSGRLSPSKWVHDGNAYGSMAWLWEGEEAFQIAEEMRDF